MAARRPPGQLWITIDYRGSGGVNYSEALGLSEALAEAGVPAQFLDINQPLERVQRLRSADTLMVLADTFRPNSPNARRFPELYAFRKYLDERKHFYIGNTFAGVARSSSGNKARARWILARAVEVPAGQVVQPTTQIEQKAKQVVRRFGLPLVTKRVFDTGASIGVDYVASNGDLVAAMREHFSTFQQPLLVEQFISGRELTAWVFDFGGGPECYGIVEIVKPPGHQIFTQGGKLLAEPAGESDDGFGWKLISPPAVRSATLRRIEATAVAAHRALKLRHYSRVDIIMRGQRAVVLEVNAKAQLRDGGLGVAALGRGESFAAAIRRLVCGAAATAGQPGTLTLRANS